MKRLFASLLILAAAFGSATDTLAAGRSSVDGSAACTGSPRTGDPG